MQDHPSSRGGIPDAAYDTPEYHAQRLLLLELVISPPPEGEKIGPLADRLEMTPETLIAALAVLARAGLAWHVADRAFPTLPAICFETLLPGHL